MMQKLDSEQLRKIYDDKYTTYRALAEGVNVALYKEINRHGIKIHSITDRIKTFDSFSGKIIRNRIVNPFEEIHDIAGIRVVCLFMPDISELGGIVRDLFDVFDEDNKICDGEMDVFGYMSLHLKARLKKECEGFEPACFKLPFEVQIRTIAQDAWATISHYLDYKQSILLSDHLRRDFHALSGLFYVADTHFSLLKQEQSNLVFDKYWKDAQRLAALDAEGDSKP